MPDLEDLRDLWEIDLELAGSDQGPIPIITTPPEGTWVWSDRPPLRRPGRSVRIPAPVRRRRPDESPSSPRMEGVAYDPTTPSSAWAMSPIRMLGATGVWCSTSETARASGFSCSGTTT